VTSHLGYKLTRSWIDAVWVVLLFFCIVLLPVHNRGLVFRWGAVWILVLICAARAVLAATNSTVEPAPFMMELKPLLYFICAFFWINCFGTPSLDAFVRAGCYLSAILTAEFAFVSAMHGGPVRPEGSGEVNYDACLLLLPFAVALCERRRYRWQLLFLGAGLVFSFSRTAQITAFLLAMMTGRLRRLQKLLVAGAALLGYFLALRVRSVSGDASVGDRFFMWTAALRMFAQNSAATLFGFGPGAPLEIDVPKQLRGLWDAQAHGIHEGGVYAFNFHSMWVRLTVSWGLLMVILLLLLLLGWMYVAKSRLAVAAAIIIFVEGLTMGVFYLSNVAIPMLLFMAMVQRRAATVAAREAPQEEPAVAEAPPPEPSTVLAKGANW
jgi:cbb3-type cytochrome oxidase subunit 3